MKDTVTVSPKDAIDLIKIYTKQGRAVCLHGDPGIGKSDMVKQFADSIGYDLLDLRLITRDPVDLTGVPYVETVGTEKRTAWAAPKLIPTEGKVVLFMDELNRAPTMTQNAAMQAVYDRAINEIKLSPDCIIIAACNRDGIGVNPVPDALMNRFCHIIVEPDIDDWSAWAMVNNIHPLVIAFLRWKPELLAAYDKKAKAFPTPRTWEFVSQLMESMQKLTKSGRLVLISGVVGHGPSIEFISFIETYEKLPSIDAILMNPESAMVPTDNAQLFAVSSALAFKATRDNFDRIMTYTERMERKEFQVMTVKYAAAKTPEVMNSQPFINWIAVNQNIMK